MPRAPVKPPIPPSPLPPARTVTVADRGEFFVRDSALARSDQPPPTPTVLLLHGWVVSADLNWHGAYAALVDAGYRVLAIDHRGHGRGLRAPDRFRLSDCAADAASVVRALDAGPVIAVGYSMGGTIAQLMARDHRDVLSAVLYSGTCQHFSDPATAKVWRWMGVLGIALGLAPRTFYRAGFRRNGIPVGETTTWMLGEFMRNEARQVAEAGRELGRFDSRPWLEQVDVPAAMVLTARDSAVSPAKQRELAAASRATVVEVALDHLDLTARTDVYNPALLRALSDLRASAR